MTIIGDYSRPPASIGLIPMLRQHQHLTMPDAKIQCDHCDQWLLVENGNSAECDCGAVFAVTVTKVLRPVTDVVETSQ